VGCRVQGSESGCRIYGVGCRSFGAGGVEGRVADVGLEVRGALGRVWTVWADVVAGCRWSPWWLFLCLGWGTLVTYPVHRPLAGAGTGGGHATTSSACSLLIRPTWPPRCPISKRHCRRAHWDLSPQGTAQSPPLCLFIQRQHFSWRPLACDWRDGCPLSCASWSPRGGRVHRSDRQRR